MCLSYLPSLPIILSSVHSCCLLSFPSEAPSTLVSVVYNHYVLARLSLLLSFMAGSMSAVCIPFSESVCLFLSAVPDELPPPPHTLKSQELSIACLMSAWRNLNLYGSLNAAAHFYFLFWMILHAFKYLSCCFEYSSACDAAAFCLLKASRIRS